MKIVTKKIISFRRNTSFFLKKKCLATGDFTIISDDCWAGTLYQDLKIPYKTPFIGLYIAPKDYIKLIENLTYYLSMPLEFIDAEKCQQNFPVGCLGDIKIYFMHYFCQEEVVAKWNRRLERVNWDNLFIKIDFGKWNYDNESIKIWNSIKDHTKIAFLKSPDPKIMDSIFVENWVFDGNAMYNISQEYFDVIHWLSKKKILCSNTYQLLYLILYDANLFIKLKALFKKYCAQ